MATPTVVADGDALPPLLERLLSALVTAAACDRHRRTALHLLCEEGAAVAEEEEEVTPELGAALVDRLLEYVEVDAVDGAGRTALHTLCCAELPAALATALAHALLDGGASCALIIQLTDMISPPQPARVSAGFPNAAGVRCVPVHGVRGAQAERRTVRVAHHVSWRTGYGIGTMAAGLPTWLSPACLLPPPLGLS
jgi:hypothetical protein